MNSYQFITLVETTIRPAASWNPATDPPTPTFVPPLSTAEQTTLTDLTVMASLGLDTLTLAAYQARKADIDGIRSYMALPSPTAAQTQAAFKALVRVVAAMLRMQLGG